MGGVKNYLNDLEVERIEKIIESYPPEAQEQIYAGTWQYSAEVVNAGRRKRELLDAQSQGSKASKSAENREVKGKLMENARKGLLTPAEVCAVLNVKVSTVYAWVSTAHIPYVRLGRLIRFDLKDVIAWVEKQKVKGDPSNHYEVKLPTNGHAL